MDRLLRQVQRMIFNLEFPAASDPRTWSGLNYLVGTLSMDVRRLHCSLPAALCSPGPFSSPIGPKDLRAIKGQVSEAALPLPSPVC